ncbi:hypothetical protein ACHQM5_021729 [Ranunculus cassubicifolius]
MKEKAGRDENGQQQPLTDEVYTEVMPNERYGRVRMMGRGVTNILGKIIKIFWRKFNSYE